MPDNEQHFGAISHLTGRQYDHHAHYNLFEVRQLDTAGKDRP